MSKSGKQIAINANDAFDCKDFEKLPFSIQQKLLNSIIVKDTDNKIGKFIKTMRDAYKILEM